ncbi:MAG: DUF3422 domain-containing protein [Pseudomonadota bacterium]
MRLALSNELHARPFPTITTPARAAFLAVRHPDGAARDRSKDREQLDRLLEPYSVHNRPDADGTHFFGQLGKRWLKWESHTEFVTYTIIASGVAETPFDGSTFEMFPADWLATMPGQRITSALIRIEDAPDDEEDIKAKLNEWFIGESLAVSRVLDDEAVVATDFRLDHCPHVRMAVFAKPSCGKRRLGRIIQRLAEIETYTKMSLLGLAMARDLGRDLNRIEAEMTGLTAAMSDDATSGETTLKSLLKVTGDLEALSTKSSFRFGATDAYAAIVNQRIKVMREERFLGRQTIGEFMMRRWDPAMRTVTSAEKRLQRLTERGSRASNLLRTRVDVERSAQNQSLLESMDQRADLQLRLQRTVEGLSVVAISYYAVSLALYLMGPLEALIGLSKAWQAAIVTLPIFGLVYWMVQRIKDKLHKDP